MALRGIIAIIALVGFSIMSYLTYVHFTQAQSFCDFSAEVSCDVVTTSIYSEVFGIPVSIMGMGYFSLVALLMVFHKKRSVFRAVVFLTAFVLVPSLYLTMTEALFIGSFCVLCETSKSLMVLILVLAFVALKKEKDSISLREIAPLLIAGLLATGITYFAQQSGGTKADYSDLMACLNEKGVVYYKSVKCSNCRRQELVFGSAYSKLNSVECHPDGKNPNPELCLEKEITKTPTFIIEQDGKEIKRVIGIQQLTDIASFAGCPFTKK